MLLATFTRDTTAFIVKTNMAANLNIHEVHEPRDRGIAILMDQGILLGYYMEISSSDQNMSCKDATKFLQLRTIFRAYVTY